jgi:hypothetical protein
MRRLTWIIVTMLAGAGLACDDKNEVPPEVLKSTPMPVTHPAPTTQEMLTGAKKTFRLGTFPLTLDVPQSWNLRSMADGEVITVGGPASSGDIDIQLLQQSQTISQAAPEAALAEAKKLMAAKPHPINLAELRPLGPGKVLEVRMISNAYVNGKLPPEVWGDAELPTIAPAQPGVPPTHTRAILNPHMVKWTFTIYLPAADKKNSVRALTFMGLGLREYERDQQFLEQMMKTLKYEE